MDIKLIPQNLAPLTSGHGIRQGLRYVRGGTVNSLRINSNRWHNKMRAGTAPRTYHHSSANRSRPYAGNGLGVHATRPNKGERPHPLRDNGDLTPPKPTTNRSALKMDLDNITRDIPCVNCGHQFNESLGRLKNDPNLTCPVCNVVTAVNAEVLLYSIKSAESYLKKLTTSKTVKMSFKF
jgi:DNA-directed RNA polymerase subunit RPC12/RpoP